MLTITPPIVLCEQTNSNSTLIQIAFTPKDIQEHSFVTRT